jgi:2-iminobutanoate/2-iminopropanoate deaminase
MTIRKVDTPGAPRMIGAYSQAVIGGGFVFLSGQIAMEPSTGEVIDGDVRAQTERVLLNLRAVLEEAGSGLGQVVKATVFLRDMDDFQAMNEVYARFFGEGIAPARATVEVARLPRDVAVEIDAIAVIGDGKDA